MPKLTKRTADSAKARAQDYFIWDHELPGLGLRVYTQVLEQAFNDANDLRNDGDSLADILDAYQERWSQTIFHVPQIELQSAEPEEEAGADRQRRSDRRTP